MAFPIETVLAEKVETVVSRDVASTRPRDYYDVRMLWLLRGGELDLATLREALEATASKRGALAAMDSWCDVMARVEQDPGMVRQWAAYARRYPYVGDMSLADACESVCEVMGAIGWGDDGTK